MRFVLESWCLVANRDLSLPEGEVTMLFTDIEGSTRLAHELGERWGAVLAEHHRVLREIWAVEEGVEVDAEGDAFFVVFRYARSAVRGAAAAQGAFARHVWPHGGAVRVRMGMHTGAPRVHDGTYWGVDVHYAARLCSAAHGGQVLLSAATRALVPDAPVDDLGEHAVKDFPAARQLYHLVVDGRRAAEFPPPRTLEVTRTNLPSIATPLVGREPELLELEQLLGDSRVRLVTLVGLGGTGKTRLAVECGSRMLDTFPDGVFLAALAPVQTPGGVAAALAGSVAAPLQAELGPEAALLEHVRKRRMLLVVDNMEHVLDAAPLLARILEAAPGVRILATSQGPLRLSAERVLALDALMVPPAGLSGRSELAGVPAVALFVERPRAADPAFTLGQANANAVAELCRRLDGLPLALELAAARIRVGGAEALLAALERGLDALGTGARDLPDRHRGLRAALNWTIALLDDEQRMLFAGLAAFADAWTIEQVDALFGAELDTWNALTALIDLSLIRTRGDGRMTMVEHVRVHARELLAASGREHECRRRHAVLMADTLEAIDLELTLDIHAFTARTQDAVEEAELAIAWARGAEPAVHRRLVAAAGRPFYFAARLLAIRDDLEALIAVDDRSDAISGRLLVSYGGMVGVSDVAPSVPWMSEAVECHRRTGTRLELLTTLTTQAWLLMVAERPAEARAAVAEGLELAAGQPDPRHRDQLEGTLAGVAIAEGNFDEAEARLEEIMSRPERTDFAAANAVSCWADCALARHDYAAALPRTVAALQQSGDVYNTIGHLTVVAAALAGQGRDAEAAELMGAADRAASEVGMGERAPNNWGGRLPRNRLPRPPRA